MRRNDTPAEELNSATLLTKQQAAEYLAVTTRYIERMVKDGRIKAFKPTGKVWRTRRACLDAFVESGATTR